MFSCSTCVISFFFTFRSLVHLKFILVYGIKMDTIYIFLNGYPLCPTIIY